MSAKLKIMCFVLLILFTAAPANADVVTMTDDFDDSGQTAALWEGPFGGSWSHPVLDGSDLGYQGVADSGGQGTAAFLASQHYFDMADLSMETLLRIDTPEGDRKDSAAGFLFVSGALTGDYGEYTIILDIDYDEGSATSEPVRRLEVWHNRVTSGGETNTLVDAVEASITSNTFYGLRLSTDSQGNIDAYLYDARDLLLAGLSDVTHAPFSAGMVGIGTSDQATFDDFSLTGDAVPIPGTVWLLGSGLAGLVGLRRKFVKA